jgi:60 kDa SS-A/Ro ribonucleoprotein
MRTNVAVFKPKITTHEGGAAKHINPEQQLRRSVMACLLWEDSFYERGTSIAERIHADVEAVLCLEDGANIVANIAYEARTKFKLRHAPLWLLVALIRAAAPITVRTDISQTVRKFYMPKSDAVRSVVAGVIAHVIQRPDELAELVAMLWKDGKHPLPNQVKKGLALAFQKFDRYSLSKYANRDSTITLRDVLFLTHPKPASDEQADLWADLANKKLKAPDTWESNLSAGADKRETFTRLLRSGLLGALALLRNLRNMQEAGVNLMDIRYGLQNMRTDRVLPFRFITAAKHVPTLEPDLEAAMFRSLADVPKLTGRTLLLVDASGSMDTPISGMSELRRIDAACALAILMREVCEDCGVIVFTTSAHEIAPRRGFALRDLISKQPPGGTDIGEAVRLANALGYDRIVVLTDEQTAARGVYNMSPVPDPLPGTKGYFVNVSVEQNGVGYGAWTHVDGWSEAIVEYITQTEIIQQEQDAEVFV